MAIVCGIDFSEHSAEAVRAGAAFAKRLGERIVLVHVVDLRAFGWAKEEFQAASLAAARSRLEQVAAQLAREGLQVEERVLAGAPDEMIVEVANSIGAGLVVVAALGHRSDVRWRVGSVATRIVRASPAPVLVVSTAEPFEACAGGERALRVLVGADFSESSDAAVRWLSTLRAVGPCDVILMHVYDPVRQWARLGIRPPVVVDAESPEIESVLLRDLRARIGEHLGTGRRDVRVRMSLDWVPESLALIALQEECDLVVVGHRRRSGLARLRHDPVSQGLLRTAPSAVACIPVIEEGLREAAPIPRISRVLAPTDFSELGNYALRYAYALLLAGGTVHLMHAVEEASLPNPLYAHYSPGTRPTPEQRAAQEKDLEVALRALVPQEAEQRGIESRVEIVHGGEPAEAIRVAAERLGVDAICMGTHGRSGLSSVMAGSVARKLASASPRPLFLVRPPDAA